MRFLLAVLMTLGLAACSSGTESAAPSPPASTPTPADPATSSPSPTPSDPDVELGAAVRTYSDAFLSGDGAAAYSLLSERCRARTPLSEFAALVEQAGTTYGRMDIESLEVKVNDEQGQATYGYADASLNQDREPWVNEAGWRNDDC